MNPQEKNLLAAFLDQLVQTKGVSKNNEADFMIRTAIGQQPDAAYLLVQRCLLQNQSIEQLSREIQTLKAQLAQLPNTSGGNSSFLGTLTTTQNQNMPYPNQSVPQQYQQPYAQPQQSNPSPSLFGSGNNPLSGFLANAATTAVGMAGGSFLYHGLSNLFSSHDSRPQHMADLPASEENNAGSFFPSFNNADNASNSFADIADSSEDSVLDIGADDFMNS